MRKNKLSEEIKKLSHQLASQRVPPNKRIPVNPNLVKEALRLEKEESRNVKTIKLLEHERDLMYSENRKIRHQVAKLLSESRKK